MLRGKVNIASKSKRIRVRPKGLPGSCWQFLSIILINKKTFQQDTQCEEVRTVLDFESLILGLVLQEIKWMVLIKDVVDCLVFHTESPFCQMHRIYNKIVIQLSLTSIAGIFCCKLQISLALLAKYIAMILSTVKLCGRYLFVSKLSGLILLKPFRFKMSMKRLVSSIYPIPPHSSRDPLCFNCIGFSCHSITEIMDEL